MKNAVTLNAANDDAWFSHWFDSSFYHQLYAHRDEHEAAGFIEALLEALQPPEKACMLDLGCGAGRHAKYLASKGYLVTGTDLASSSIRTAKKSATNNLQFYRHDMRMPFGNNRYDYVFNFFTSFGYFQNEDENNRVINNIYQALKPGALLVLDYINSCYSEERMVPEEIKEVDGIVYRISRWGDERFFYKKICIDILRPEGPLEYTEQVAKFDVHDFEVMFRSTGLCLEKVYGNYQLDDYDNNNSPRLILIARKSA